MNKWTWISFTIRQDHFPGMILTFLVLLPEAFNLIKILNILIECFLRLYILRRAFYVNTSTEGFADLYMQSDMLAC